MPVDTERRRWLATGTAAAAAAAAAAAVLPGGWFAAPRAHAATAPPATSLPGPPARSASCWSTPPGGVSDAIVRLLADRLALALATPVRVEYRPGTTGHLVLAQWQRASRCEVTHIPYKGGGQQLSDALAGHIELLSTNVAAAQLQHIRSGQLKPLAVGAPQRLAGLPQVPTWAELGLPTANLASVFGLLAPAGTAAAVLERLNAEINLALAGPLLRAALRAADNLATGGSADDFALQIRQEHAQHRVLLQQAPITLD